jgi:phosphoglycerate kinase
MKEGDIPVMDNLRFNKGEKTNSSAFAKTLASLADIYVNDAFANSHRKHASMDAIKMRLPAYAGLLLEQEIQNLQTLVSTKDSLVVILGGSKIATKLPLINKFKNKAHRIIIGGALANNFLKTHDYEVGKSLTDKDSLSFARNYKKQNLLIPIDVVVARDDKSSQGVIKNIKDVKKNEHIFDIGPKTINLYSSVIRKAKTIIWNGPMGFFEVKAFRNGSVSIGRAIAERSQGRCFGVVGGGETIEVLKMTKLMNNIDWISTGGGAMLAYLGEEEMPGLSKIIR